MRKLFGWRRVLVASVCAAVAFTGIVASPAFASDAAYKFEVVGQPVKAGHDAPLTVQVTQASTGAVVPGVTLTAPKLHMLMGQMDMPASVTLLDPAGLQLKGDLTMYGEWTLDVMATVPGEAAPVPATIKFVVEK